MESYRIGQLVEVRINLISPQVVSHIILAFFFSLSIIYTYFRKKGRKIPERKLKTGLMEMRKIVLGMISFSFPLAILRT